jgi:hypothetical protein
MKSKFRHIALLGKYHLNSGSSVKPSSKQTLESIAQFLHTQGCEVTLEHDTAAGSGLIGYPVMTMDEIGKTCDLAIVVDQDLALQTLLDGLKGQVSSLVQDIQLFDVYVGKGIPENKKSLAFRIVMQDTQRTLQDSEVDAAMQQLVSCFEQAFGAQLRA